MQTNCTVTYQDCWPEMSKARPEAKDIKLDDELEDSQISFMWENQLVEKGLFGLLSDILLDCKFL